MLYQNYIIYSRVADGAFALLHQVLPTRRAQLLSKAASTGVTRAPYKQSGRGPGPCATAPAVRRLRHSNVVENCPAHPQARYIFLESSSFITIARNQLFEDHVGLITHLRGAYFPVDHDPPLFRTSQFHALEARQTLFYIIEHLDI